LGFATIGKVTRKRETGTLQYRSPEIVLESESGRATDIWSLACVLFKIGKAEYLFPISSGVELERNYEHMMLMERYLGRIPRKISVRGKRYDSLFNNRGDLRKTEFEAVRKRVESLSEKGWRQVDATSFINLLMGMLAFAPETRSSVDDLITHPFFERIF
jgi:serine/threonine protein kinase